MNGEFWILATIASLLVFGVGVELGLRRWLRRWGGYYVWSPGVRLHLYVDREVLPELEPLARIEVNADGERGGAVPRTSGHLYRILVAGGSPVECALLDQPTSWPGALERLLKAPESLRTLGASNVHVGNIGLSGVTSQALNFIFERVLRRYRRLDAIVIMVGGNDVFFWLAKGAPDPIAPCPIPASEVFFCHPEGPFRWTRGGLAIVQVLQRLRCRLLRPVKIRHGSGKWVGRARAMRARAREVRTAVPGPTPMLDFFEAQLRELLEKAKRRADRVLVVRQPWFEKQYTAAEQAKLWHGALGDPHEEEVSVYYSIDVLCRLMAALDARAAQVAADVGVEQLDLMPLLEPSLKTFYDFVHYTPAGAATVAEAVAAAILGRTVSEEAMHSTSVVLSR